MGDSHRDWTEHDHDRSGASVVLAGRSRDGRPWLSSSTVNLAAVTPTRWLGQGATIGVPLTVEALNQSGAPQANIAVNFAIVNGTATLSAASATTNSSGFATVTANLTNLNASVQVSACTVFQSNTICSSQPFTLYSTPSSLWTLETVSGSSQVVPAGQPFQSLVMRVTDGSLAANPVMGVNVTFATTLARISTGQGGPPGGDSLVADDGQPPRIVADAGRDHSGRPRLHRALRRGKRGPVRCVHHGECGCLERAASNGERGSDRYGSARQQLRQGSDCAARSAFRSALWFANVRATKPAGGAGRGAARRSAGWPGREPEPVFRTRVRILASSTGSSSGASGNPGAGDVSSCEPASGLPHVEAEAPRPPAEPSSKPQAESTERDHGGGAARQPAETPPANHASANDPSANDPPADNPSVGRPVESRLLEDKRSCRFAQSEGTIPPVGNPAVSRLLEDKRSCRFAQSEDGTFFGTTIGSLP